VHELESTIEDLTKGYLSAAKTKKLLSFGRYRPPDIIAKIAKYE